MGLHETAFSLGCMSLHHLQDSCPDFKKRFCSDESFPLAVFSFGVLQEQEECRLKIFKVRE